ncbi:MAG: hypothetical protein C0524_03730 [Rhodobacter sp.]|nr:hypothetical protein [Rhodobacter sp.]
MTRSETKTLRLRTRHRLLTRLISAAAEALARRRDRQTLARLDAHILRDIGLSADEAKAECAKPFWCP